MSVWDACSAIIMVLNAFGDALGDDSEFQLFQLFSLFLSSLCHLWCDWKVGNGDLSFLRLQ